MVIASGRVGQEGTLKYMKAMLDFYQKSYRMMAPTVSPFDFMSGPAAEHHGGAETPAATAPDRAAENSHTRPAAAANVEDVTEMKRRLAELEEVVSRIAPKSAPRKKKPGKRTS
jgi:hypothetical protein